MSIKSITLLTLALASTPLLAKNYLTLMGGGGEPKGASTIFDAQAGLTGDFSKNSDWEVNLTFNGGHSRTEEILRTRFKADVANTPFTPDAYSKMIKNYEDKIRNGVIGPGDQLMLIVSTHGAYATPYDKTHQVAATGGVMTNLDTGAGAVNVSLDKLQVLADLAKEKNIKLAIVDLSCHSGNSLPLQNENTCVISGTGPNHYGYSGLDNSTFSNNFISQMKKGMNLEDVFLRSRASSTDPAFPMISSPVGLEINEELYDLLTPYLYSYAPNSEKFTKYISSEAKKGEACEAPEAFHKLDALIAEVEALKDVSKNALYNSSQAGYFRKALQEYYDLQTSLRQELGVLNIPDLKAKEKFTENYTPAPFVTGLTSMEYSIEEILSVDLEWLRRYLVNQIVSKSKPDPALQAQLNLIPKIQQRREELLALYPDLNKAKNFFQNQSRLEARTWGLARKVASESKAFYQSRYLQKKETDQRPNPCKDFVL